MPFTIRRIFQDNSTGMYGWNSVTGETVESENEAIKIVDSPMPKGCIEIEAVYFLSTPNGGRSVEILAYRKRSKKTGKQLERRVFPIVKSYE